MVEGRLLLRLGELARLLLLDGDEVEPELLEEREGELAEPPPLLREREGVVVFGVVLGVVFGRVVLGVVLDGFVVAGRVVLGVVLDGRVVVAGFDVLVAGRVVP